MKPIYLCNTLNRKKEEFKPIKKGEVGLYTCGPTVYNYAHIGNLRTYIFEDTLRRVLEYNGFKVKHVMNITDVGHLTGDRDAGEDKLEKGAKREGKTAWEVAEFYTEAFKKDMEALNIAEPNVWCKATDYIAEQIKLIKQLEAKGYTYVISDGVYFDTSKFSDYTKLSHQNIEALEEGARVEINEEKKHPTDFALWKFSPKGSKRDMEWASPWGIGFPGWHVECSAMSLAHLEDQLDIHCGGMDHVDVHHTNEIAQSEAATGMNFFNYWMHGAFLNIEGGKKMAKSADNFLTLENALIKKDIPPIVYRFAALQVSYRKPMEYSEEIIENAKSGYKHLLNRVKDLGDSKGEINMDYQQRFLDAVNDDLNMPQALAVAQEMLRSDLSNEDKLTTILDFDRVLGLKIEDYNNDTAIPAEILEIAERRKRAREDKDWQLSDELRDEIDRLGYLIKDLADNNFSIHQK